MMLTQPARRASTGSRASARASNPEPTVVRTMTGFTSIAVVGAVCNQSCRVPRHIVRRRFDLCMLQERNGQNGEGVPAAESDVGRHDGPLGMVQIVLLHQLETMTVKDPHRRGDA